MWSAFFNNALKVTRQVPMGINNRNYLTYTFYSLLSDNNDAVSPYAGENATGLFINYNGLILLGRKHQQFHNSGGCK